MGHRHRRYAPLPVALLLVAVISFAYLPRTGHAGSSDLTVDSIWLEDASQPGQPISQVSSGQSFLIVATIKNIGQEAGSGYYVDVYYDNDYGRGGPDNILAGEVQTWYVGPLTAQDGTHTTKWVVDPDNLIAELDETNNQKEYTFTVGYQTSTTTATSSSTSSSPASSSTTTLTLTLAVQSTQFVTSILTTTLLSYTETETSTSTIMVPATVIVGPSTMTTTAQTTQVLTSTGTTTLTGYTTTTVTSYIGTSTSTSTIVVPTTVAVSTSGPIVQTTEVLPATSTVQTMQVLTLTGTTTVTGYTTTTVTSYTDTSTSTSTSVVYTTVASLAGSPASSPLAYLGFISLLAIAAGQRAVAGRSRRIPHMPSPRGPSRSPLSVPCRHASSTSANVTRSLFAQYHSWKGGV